MRSQVNEVPSVEDKFERFGGKKIGMPMRLELRTAPTPERNQIIRKSDDRMIQVQNSRFLLNWRKKEDQDYPDFEDLYDEFLGYLEKFKAFIKDASGENLNLNQWEITYVNHITKGELWNTVQDWPDLFPCLSLPRMETYKQQLETMRAEWSITLLNEIGRLHIKLHHAIAGSLEGPEIIALELTSRGPVDEKRNFEDGLKIGHKAIVNTFTEITSENAHKYWS